MWSDQLSGVSSSPLDPPPIHPRRLKNSNIPTATAIMMAQAA
jgi:hypothetical protein